MKLCLTPNTNVQQVLQPPISKLTHLFCCPFFFKEYLNLKVMINEVVNEHSADSQTNLLGLTLRGGRETMLNVHKSSHLKLQSYFFKNTYKRINF